MLMDIWGHWASQLVNATIRRHDVDAPTWDDIASDEDDLLEAQPTQYSYRKDAAFKAGGCSAPPSGQKLPKLPPSPFAAGAPELAPLPPSPFAAPAQPNNGLVACAV